jgi:integrase
MKGKRRHIVPLSVRCLEILLEAKALAGTSDLVFPGRTSTTPLSNMVFLMTMRRMQLSAVPHGFRSTFRDWASEQTSFPNEVCEMALAHAIRDKTEAAYRRGDLLEKRRALMEAWASYAVPITPTALCL